MDRLDARPEIEVIVMARGGGDAAQLLPFSDEDLCRAIAASRTPVVTAIGHEGDRPLCDAVADLRCGTPSLAAAAVVPSRAELEQELDRLLSLVAAAALARLDHRARLLAAVDVGGTLAGRLAAAAGRVAVDGGRLQLLHPRRRTAGAAAAMARVDWERPVRARWARAKCCYASFPPGRSTGRSESSIICPPKRWVWLPRRRRRHHRSATSSS